MWPTTWWIKLKDVKKINIFWKLSKTHHPAHEPPLLIPDSKSSCFFTSSCKIWWRLMHWECVWRQKYTFLGKNQKLVSISWTTRLNTHFESPGVSKNNSPCHFPSDFIYWSIILTIEKCFFDVTKFFFEVFFWCVEGWSEVTMGNDFRTPVFSKEKCISKY